MNELIVRNECIKYSQCMSSAAVSTVRRFMDAHAINVAAPTLRVLATDVIFLYLKTQWDWFDVLVTRQTYCTQELLSSLGLLSDQDLEGWAHDNREKLTIGFLSWIEEELTESANEVERKRLWELGAKLMAIREGLSPVAASKLMNELSTATASAVPDVESRVGISARATTGIQNPRKAEPSPVSLSMEGMRLLEQQAAALEVSLGATKAQALTEIIGRKTASASDNSIAYGLMAAHTAGRILEVLIQIDSREERCAMLPDAFIPPDQDLDQSGTSDEEDALCTTPWQLLQAIDLWMKRSRQELLEIGDINPDKAIENLKELREDLLGYLDFSNIDDF